MKPTPKAFASRLADPLNRKSQIPSSKSQANSKFQFSKVTRRPFFPFGTYLGFGIWDLGFGIWDLGFGIWNLRSLRRRHREFQGGMREF